MSQIIGLDLARPDSDLSVFAVMRDGILQQFAPLPPMAPIGTAVEVEMRLAEYWRKHGHLYERMAKAWPLRRLSPSLPLIRYGRRKRRWRRLGATHIGLSSGKGWQVPDVKIVVR